MIVPVPIWADAGYTRIPAKQRARSFICFSADLLASSFSTSRLRSCLADEWPSRLDRSIVPEEVAKVFIQQAVQNGLPQDRLQPFVEIEMFALRQDGIESK